MLRADILAGNTDVLECSREARLVMFGLRIALNAHWALRALPRSVTVERLCAFEMLYAGYMRTSLSAADLLGKPEKTILV